MNESNGSAPRSRRDLILSQVGQLEEVPATLPGPNGPVDVLVRELTGAEARLFEQAVQKGSAAPLGFMLCMSLVDPETHALIFQLADREAVESLGFSKLRPLIEIATKLSGLSEEDIEKAKASLVSGPPTS